MQRGLPRESFEQNEVDGYRTGRPQEPSGARSNPPEAVSRGVPPRERASSRWCSGCLGTYRQGAASTAARRGNPTTPAWEVEVRVST